MMDLYQDPKKIEAVKKDFKEHRGDAPYKGLLPDGPPPFDKAK